MKAVNQTLLWTTEVYQDCLKGWVSDNILFSYVYFTNSNAKLLVSPSDGHGNYQGSNIITDVYKLCTCKFKPSQCTSEQQNITMSEMFLLG